jgi:hypothetical protein
VVHQRIVELTSILPSWAISLLSAKVLDDDVPYYTTYRYSTTKTDKFWVNSLKKKNLVCVARRPPFLRYSHTQQQQQPKHLRGLDLHFKTYGMYTISCLDVCDSGKYSLSKKGGARAFLCNSNFLALFAFYNKSTVK